MQFNFAICSENDYYLICLENNVFQMTIYLVLVNSDIRVTRSKKLMLSRLSRVFQIKNENEQMKLRT